MSDREQASGVAAARAQAVVPAFDRAVEAFERGELETAVVLCQETLEADPVDFDALHLLGLAKSRLRQIEDALALFDRALAARPGHPDVCNNRGSALVELGRLPEALAAYDAALAARGDFADAHNNRGSVLMIMGRPDDALASYGRALVLAPDNADTMNNLGRALIGLRRYDDALDCFDDAIAQQPGFSDAMLNRGRVLELRHEFEDAVVAYGEAMDAGAEIIDAMFRRAGALQAGQRYREALSDYDRALRLAPDRHDIRSARAAMLAPAGRAAAVLAEVERAAGIEHKPLNQHCSDAASGSIIDRLHVITLARTPERFETFVDMNRHLPIERFLGADGRSLDRWDVVDEGLITPGNPYALRSVGCAVSHIRLWQTCVAQDRPIHIAEDDAVFRHDFLPMASAMLSTLADWDIVNWGWNFDWPMQVVLGDGLGPAMVRCDETALRARSAAFPAATTVPTMLRLMSNAGNCAYSLSPAGARDLLQRCLPLSGKIAVYPGEPDACVLNRTLDIEMTRHYASMKAFVCFPCLAISLNVKAAPTPC